MKTTNRHPAALRHASASRATRTFAAAASALAAALLALGTSDLMAAPISWQPNPADQGVSVTIANDGSKWTVSQPLREGDAVRTGSVSATDTGVGLTNTEIYYYVVGVGSVPSADVRFAQHPSGVGIGGASGSITAPRMPTWNTIGNWAGGVVPNGQDVAAVIATNAGTPAVMLDQDTTLGSLDVDTTAGSLSLLATARNGGMVSTLSLKTSTGTPTIRVSGGNSLTLSESKIFSTTPSPANAKLFLVGNQGLVIENNNTINAPVAVTGTPPNFAAGSVRFGFGLNWTDFTGDLTLAKGTFLSLCGGSANNGISSLPMNNTLVLGTGTNTARLEIANGSGQSSVRGLASSPTAISSIINVTGGTGSQTFQVGSCGSPTDVYDYAGNIGDTSSGLANTSAIRLTKVGAGTQILSGVNNINAMQTNQAMIAINGGKLSLGSTGALGTITDGQGTMNTNSYVQIRNGEFELVGGGSAAARSQTFSASVVFGTMAANSASPDSNQLMQSSGANILTVTAVSGQSSTLTFGSIRPRGYGGSNLNGSTTLYRGTGLGSTPGAGVASILATTPPTIGAPGLLAATAGSGATLGSVQAPVLKGALADTSPTGTGAGFATYDASVGVRLLASSEQSTAAYDGAPTTDNLRINLVADATIAGQLSNTLQIDNVSGVARTVTNSTTTLNPANGLLFSGSSPIVLTGGQITGTADTNAEDVVIQSINTSPAGVTIQTPISNVGNSGALQGWISYSGPGNFRVEGTQAIGNGATGGSSTSSGIAFNGTGTTTLAGSITSTANNVLFNFNRGVVKLDAGATWTKTPRILIAAGAKFDLNGQGGTATERRFSDLAGSFSVSTIAFNPSGGEVTNSAGGAAVDLVLAGRFDGGVTSPFFGTITGNLNLVVDKSEVASTDPETGAPLTFNYGIQTLAAANTYTGSTQIKSGTLNLTRYGQLPPASVVTFGTSGGIQRSTLALGDSVANANVPVRAVVGGLEVVTGSTGLNEVINNSTVISQLVLNIPADVTNSYSGNLGISTAPVQGHNNNLFSIRKIGAGTFEPTGAVVQYTGGTIIEGGVFRVSADDKLGQVGPFMGTGHATATTGAAPAPMSAFLNSLILNGGTLQTTTTTDFVLNPKRGIGLGPTSGSAGGTGTLSVDSGVTLTYGGVIASAGNTGTQTLVKTGPGLLALEGTSTFTGVTQVTGGSLGGTGTLASGVVVDAGGALAPGKNGVGTFHINGPLTFHVGSSLNVDLAAPATPLVSDLVQMSGGSVTATGTTTVNVTALSGFGVGTYTLISGGGTVNASNFVLGSMPAGLTGSFSASGGSLILTVVEGSALSPVETWRQTHFGITTNTGEAADSADPDADGLPNLIEYATNTLPKQANVSPVTVARAGNFLTLTYTRIADGSLTYTVEGVSDLTGTWTTISAAGNPSTGASNVAGQVTIQDDTAVTSRRFLRLKVSH